jgi:hypothetical protein
MHWLESLAVAATNHIVNCSLQWGKGSREAKNMEQELLDSGMCAMWQDVALPLGGPAGGVCTVRYPSLQAADLLVLLA